MHQENIRCVLLADRHHGLIEGMRSLLETTFEAVVMVADEVSLLESASRLPVSLVVVDLSLARGDGIGMIRRFRDQFPKMKMIVISVLDDPSVCKSTLEAGANGFVTKTAIATDLLPTVDAVLEEQCYVIHTGRVAREQMVQHDNVIWKNWFNLDSFYNANVNNDWRRANSSNTPAELLAIGHGTLIRMHLLP